MHIMYPSGVYLKELPDMKTLGEYKAGFPEGAIIHYTAGRQDQSGIMAIQSAIEQGHCYFFINESGMIYQQFDLTRYGQHAGLSKCPVTKRNSVSKYYVGIEIACAGKLIKGKAWYGQKISEHKIREVNGVQFEAYTPEQEESLFNLCLWLCENGADPDLILGHNEVTARKLDPGGSLSMSMEEFRMRVKEQLNGNFPSDH